MRAFHRVLKLARTIANLADAEQIGLPRLHVLLTRLLTVISGAHGWLLSRSCDTIR